MLVALIGLVVLCALAIWIVQDICAAIQAPAPNALGINAYLAADVTAGLPNEEMVRAAIVEFMADESSDVDARISRLESDLDFYVLGKGEGVARPSGTRQHGDVLCDCGSPICALRRRFHQKPACECVNPVHIQVLGSDDAYCGICGGRAPVANWYGMVEPLDTGQRETR